MTLLNYLNGKISPKQIIQIINDSKVDISTEEKRLQIYAKMQWVTWSTQDWNSNYSNISYENFLKEEQELLDSGATSYSTIWIKTGVI